MSFFAYIHATPDGLPFYVGKGKLRRAYDFKFNRNKWYLRKVAKHGEPIVCKIECSSEQIAFELEIGLIKCLKRQGFELVNMTNGGEGTSGRPA